jgi:hypothetical protein
MGSVALLIAAAFAPTSLAAAPFPNAGTAVVDGDPSEWVAGDHFADMTADGNPANDTVATLSLRYDCEAGTLFALVDAVDGVQLKQDRPDQAYIQIDGSGKAVQASTGNDGTPPDFSWVNGDGARADGYEASLPLAPGSYTIRAHVLIPWDDSDGYLTIDTTPRHSPLTIECVEPTPTPSEEPSGSVEPSEEPSATPSEEPSGSVEPSEEPSGSVAPSESPAGPTDEPSGAVAPATGTPNITLPPTDALATAGTGTGGGSGLQLALFGMAALLGALALLTPARRARVTKSDRS